jgi:hypothetical protein
VRLKVLLAAVRIANPLIFSLYSNLWPTYVSQLSEAYFLLYLLSGNTKITCFINLVSILKHLMLLRYVVPTGCELKLYA